MKFIWIGVLGATLYAAITTIAVRLGGEPQLSSLLSYGLLVPFIYMLHSRFSFESKAAHRTAFPRYIVVQATALSLSFLLPPLLSPLFGGANAVLFIAIAVIISAMNFLASLMWAFAAPGK
ncbi:GtrA family protein [Taklimakanibacter lacteus]|uniref:GtrA family protein n=1 Tax=Taklimakanibacter lacteus TaxID=2268456 RepID=UPI0013C4B66C